MKIGFFERFDNSHHRSILESISPNRIAAIDHFRGVTIILMVIVNHLSGIRVVPDWMKHAPGIGLTFVDIIAPAFLFAIGLTYRMSYQGRVAAAGTPITVRHFVVRWLAIIGIGSLIAAGETLTGATGRVADWGVLQSIGVAGLLSLPLIMRSWKVRLVTAVFVLAVYQIGYELFFQVQVLESAHGGLWGALSWTGILLLSTVLGDLSGSQLARKTPARAALALAIVSVAIGAAGILLALLVPVSKLRISASYALVSVSISGMVYSAFLALGRVEIPPLQWWGKNPLLLYLLHYVLLGLVVLPSVDRWYEAAPAWLAALQSAVLLGCLTVVAWWMNQRRQVLKL